MGATAEQVLLRAGNMVVTSDNAVYTVKAFLTQSALGDFRYM
jgi:hypothetical protein